MSSRQEQLRARIVQFYNNQIDDKLKKTVDHFLAEKIPRSSIYRIIKNFITRMTTNRKTGSGRKAKIMTTQMKCKLVKMFNNADGISQRQEAKKINCDHSYVCKSLKKLGIKCRKKKKSPKYINENIGKIRSQCRWLVKNYGKLDFILDDEKYFPLSASHIPGNDIFYSQDPKSAPAEIKFKGKKKFEAKLMLWIAISNKGISAPYFREGGLAINQQIYINKCLKPKLIPFIKKFHQDNNYVFWSDKASSHYSKKSLEFMQSQNVRFVPKDRNPTDLPQCRPIEDFFGVLSQIVYKNCWSAENISQLKNRIRYSLKKVDPKVVQSMIQGIRTKLRKCADNGPYALVH